VKEADFRPADILARYLALCREDAAAVLRREAEFVTVPCPGCGAEASEPAFTKNGYHYHTCAACQSLYLRQRPTTEVLAEVNNGAASAAYWADCFYPNVIERRRESVYRTRALYAQQLQQQYGQTFRRLLDVGAGCGIYAEELRRAMPAVDIAVVEPGPRFAATCREKGFETHMCLLEELPADVPPACYGSCFEVLEHLYSPLAFLQVMARALRPGGVVFLTSLCCDGFDVQALWERHPNIYPPQHINILSLAGYRQLFERAGFTDIRLTTPGKLDVDIVRNHLPAADQPRVLRHLLQGGDETFLRDFQLFLAEHRRSSHVWITASRGAA
jgi:SAM-dependent methyltransferase